MSRLSRMIIAATLVMPSLAAANSVTVYKTPTCGCCSAWVEHMRANGFELDVQDVERSELIERKEALGVEPGLSSCHTATVNDYVIEGHVPAADVRRLLETSPDVVGIAVPGMPAGSPGMDYGQKSESYEVVTFDDSGESGVFARH